MENKEIKNDVTERIKTFEDAMNETGRPNVPDFSNLPEDMRRYFAALYAMTVIAEALNEGWKADWSDSDQCKYFPWFWWDNSLSPSRFAFRGTAYRHSSASAGDCSRLCFKTRAIAQYCGQQFIEIWNDILNA